LAATALARADGAVFVADVAGVAGQRDLRSAGEILEIVSSAFCSIGEV
jgi:hypothetical protein